MEEFLIGGSWLMATTSSLSLNTDSQNIVCHLRENEMHSKLSPDVYFQTFQLYLIVCVT